MLIAAWFRHIAGMEWGTMRYLNKERIREYLTQSFGYDLADPIASIRAWYRFDVSCQDSVPQAIIAFLESRDFEDAIRMAISIGGGSDTIACIAGGIAQVFY
jgi:ADP-ribosylglycohydrolase